MRCIDVGTKGALPIYNIVIIVIIIIFYSKANILFICGAIAVCINLDLILSNM